VHNTLEELALLIFWARLGTLIAVPGVLALGGWLISMDRRARKMEDQVGKIMDLHEHPEASGFGTRGVVKAIDRDSRLLRELIHYIKWMVKQQSGKEPPPYVGDE